MWTSKFASKSNESLVMMLFLDDLISLFRAQGSATFVLRT